MSDIVERLYGWQAHFETEPENELLCAELGEAAKELNRLREALYRINGQLENAEAALIIACRESKEALGDG